MYTSIKLGVQSILRGFGQVMLQRNAWTGLLFLLAICYDSFLMAGIALISNIIGTLTAKLLKFRELNIENGIYGFNATLTGIALAFYFQLNSIVLLTIFIGCILSTLLMELSIRYKIPVFTFPFILIVGIALMVLNIFEIAEKSIPENVVDIIKFEELTDFFVQGHAFGQVLFQGSEVAGLIFLLGVYINSPIAALYAFVATTISVAISHFGKGPLDMINSGMYSFNAVLCGIAFSGPKPRDGVFVFISVVVATLFDMLMVHYGWTTLTFPFVVAMWVVLPIRGLLTYIESKIIKLNQIILSKKQK
ncbi:MAG: urea transporter [Candidatus Pedobacter colombiensis]|uniref:Urea transporter n=1 Tax=Candidatus Pedobacter colombiensis TaxID=3121371 RepID=A0AAJ5WDY3_9SPHI|nr:urea transporter [Pedobacter sp.]WEK21719.1 MAG: urea transporter [Pedobacter sp.]